MIDSAWPPEFENVVRGYLPLFPRGQALPPDLDLHAHGLDSLGAVGLLVALEEGFSVAIPEDALVPDIFETPENLWEAVMAAALPRGVSRPMQDSA